MSTQKQNLVAVVAIALSCLLPSGANAQLEANEAVKVAYEAGKALQEAGDHEGAIQKFDEGIAADIEGIFAPLHFAKAESLRTLEDYDNAVTSYKNAVTINPKLAQAYNGRGICYREQGLMDLALNDFRVAAESDRRDPFSAANLGDILVNTYQQPIEAMTYLDRAIELTPEDAESYRNRGWAYTLLRDFEKGIVDLNKAIELDPSDFETYQRLANVHLAERDYQLSIDALSKAIEYYEPKENSDPKTYITGFLQRAASRMTLAKEADQTPEQRSKLYSEIVADADAVLAEFPDRFPEAGLALYRRGTALRMQELFSEAIVAFTNSIQLIPAGSEGSYSGEAFLIRGICWFYQGQNDLARGDFKEAAALSLVDPLPYLWIGYSRAEEGQFRDAIESYGEAAARSPTFALAHVNRGLAYMQLKDYKKAVFNFNEAIRSEPTEPKHFFKRGMAHEQLEEWQKALDSYEIALHHDGNYADANQGAARALQALGRPGLGNQYQNRVNP